MTIHITTSRVRYVADGVQTVFPYNFRIFQDNNLNVYVDDTLMVLVTDYEMTNNGDETGGEVTFVVPPDVNATVTLERVLDNQQLLDLIEFDRFPAESVEAGLDYIVLLIQQNSDAVAHALQASISTPDDVDLTVPAPGNGEYWRWSDDGKSIVTTDITKLEGEFIPEATDGEIIGGTEAQVRLISPAQVKLGVTTHETAPLTDINNVAWVEVVDTLPGTPDPTKLYLVRQ